MGSHPDFRWRIQYRKARKTTVKIVRMQLQARDDGNLDYGSVRRNRFGISCGGKNSKTYWRSQKEGIKD